MSGIALCTDSSALFPAGVADRLGVSVVPIAIALDGTPLDGPELDADRFYDRLEGGAIPTTSQPSPGDFLDAYTRAASRGAKEVLSIHLDARVSGTVASAELAGREAPIPVMVLDTATVSFGVGACVRAAAELVTAGASADEAARAARRLGSELANAFVAPTGSGGRIGEVSGWAVLEFADAGACPVIECTDVGESIDVMMRRACSQGVPVRAAVGHAAEASESAADALALALDAAEEVVSVERYRVGPAVGAHTGPLSFGAFWWPAD